jgi:uncharacterized protein (TIGR03067 family)
MNVSNAARVACLFWLVLPLPAGADDPNEADLKRIEGAWQMINADQDGVPVPEEAIRNQSIVFEKGTYEVLNKEEVVENGTFAIDASKTPHTIDLKIEKGEGQGKTQLGIYAFEGETLKCAFALPGASQRPEKLESRPNTDIFVLSLERKPAAQ